ncbi:uncharacterized protein CPUR_05192 [Claviceps purpurea 20.1]|uniref:Uncharacterized protein n=1 Tax=Claviceps purpurea (strain 20.1) TaxID=1111077 RepID=M1W1X1_CLAP2|nr:uncharacterized protein CPUR_05192 [Claviceps purpurea 20.1]
MHALLDPHVLAQSQLLQSRPDEGLSQAGVHDLALATVWNDRQDLGEVAAESDRDAANEDVVVRAAQVDQHTVDGRPRSKPLQVTLEVSKDANHALSFTRRVLFKGCEGSSRILDVCARGNGYQ